MGRTYLFECVKCGYQARVSGGEDSGAMLSTQTILCRNCKSLYDVVTRLKVPGIAVSRARFGFDELDGGRPRGTQPPSFAAALNRLPPPAAEKLEWMQFELRCPLSPIHRVRPWKNPDRCPRCGVYLEQAPLPFRIWD